jgi:hypothetical protein
MLTSSLLSSCLSFFLFKFFSYSLFPLHDILLRPCLLSVVRNLLSFPLFIFIVSSSVCFFVTSLLFCLFHYAYFYSFPFLVFPFSYYYILYIIFCFMPRSWDNAVGIATSCGLDGRMVGVRGPGGATFFFFSTSSRPVPGAHPASYPMDTMGSFHEIKLPGREADHLPSTSAEVKNTWIYTYTPPYSFMA